jgi:pyruvate dehydrogenase E1 component beta subunit
LVPQPYNHKLEMAAIPDHEDVVKAVLKLFGKA